MSKLFLEDEQPADEGTSSLFRLTVLNEVASTNEVIKRAIEAGEPEGFAVRAGKQTGGYGRQGRVWASPEGGMYMSLLLRPKVTPVQLPTLSLAISVAARRGIAALEGLANPHDVQVKWPNDLVVPRVFPADEVHSYQDEGRLEALPSLRNSYRKLCGISLEVHGGGVCVGIGVNVQKTRFSPAETAQNTPIYLTELGYAGSISEVAFSVLQSLELVYTQWHREGFTPFQNEYESSFFLSGRVVGMVDQFGSLIAEGTVVGLDQEGRLILRTSDGSFVPVSSGEAHMR